MKFNCLTLSRPIATATAPQGGGHESWLAATVRGNFHVPDLDREEEPRQRYRYDGPKEAKE